ncbi:phytoene/squalene synthase family protein [Jiella sp. MQZ9-1]|uniref:Phytoene/squalene synthase family protein n=1 Tax=Jiella flava TaxID=2816857 RepID=A0A939FY84_9HYPH|nr:phytoene/squalene synthase family protein [Jiella flava]MBO0663672.1 phytoene/squalene synthase family protein [Jiella flava]MCD2472245.1 phytoene/squalene synthase family protein [Jiella flava]
MSSASEPLPLPIEGIARDDLAAHAEETIAKGSKSFAAAAKLFAPETRRSAMMLYAWCRHCDDAVDGQILGFARAPADCAAKARERLDRIEADTMRALAGERALHPSFLSIADVVARHDLSPQLLLDHLAGYRMDVEGRLYETIEETLAYCYHVAGVVGVMMARVMGADGEATLDRACDLGLGFQLTNIARDIVEDAGAGRVYLPAVWLDEAKLKPSDLSDPTRRRAVGALAIRLVDCAEPYYRSALVGLSALPPRSAWAVATAHGVYRQIGMELKSAGAAAYGDRVSTGTLAKLRHVGQGAAKVASSRLGPSAPRPPELWTRPR